MPLPARNITIFGHRTSVRLEPEVWEGLEEVSRREGWTIHEICSVIESRRRDRSLTTELRAFVFVYFREAATEAGHDQAGHGRLWVAGRMPVLASARR